MFRFPKALIDRRLIDPYCLDDCVDLARSGRQPDFEYHVGR